MNEKYNDATPNRPEGERTIDAPLVSIDLDACMHQIKNEEAWKKNDRNAITVFKTKGLRLVLIALHARAEMKPHTSDGLISLQVLEGHIQLITARETVEVKKEQIATLHENITHSIIAVKETTFLLTMTGS